MWLFHWTILSGFWQQLLDELTKKLPLEESHYKIYLIPDSNVNAIALPGGNIVIFSGLLEEIDSVNRIKTLGKKIKKEEYLIKETISY